VLFLWLEQRTAEQGMEQSARVQGGKEQQTMENVKTSTANSMQPVSSPSHLLQQGPMQTMSAALLLQAHLPFCD
jgi:hypothetical protein